MQSGYSILSFDLASSRVIYACGDRSNELFPEDRERTYARTDRFAYIYIYMDGINVVLNILCRLPVKSLKRFQCASKSWHDLIHKPDFITQHLHVFNSSRKFDDQRRHSSCLLVNGVGTWWDRYRPTRFLHKVYVNLLDLDQTNGEVNSRHVLNLPLDYQDENPGVQILGPCNGIYCLHRTNEYHMVHVILQS